MLPNFNKHQQNFHNCTFKLKFTSISHHQETLQEFLKYFFLFTYKGSCNDNIRKIQRDVNGFVRKKFIRYFR